MGMILNMKKMAMMKMNHRLEKMKKLGMMYNMKKMERMVMNFQMKKVVMTEKIEMTVMILHMVMIEKNRFLLLSLSQLSLCMKLIQMGRKEMN